MGENTFIHKEVFRLLCEDEIGSGMSRRVWTSPFLPGRVVKTEEGSRRFQNVFEWETWNQVKDTKWARWFAPCVTISPCGGVLVMERTSRPTEKQFVARMPVFLTDFKRENYGMLKGRLVCHDYGTNVLMQTGLNDRLKKVEWWDA